MIEVEQLTRSYGKLTAVDRVGFRVDKGEVVGFLGRNGAGKTTTMRILTGSLGATSGTVRIGGFDVARDRRAVQRIVGYLPETPPLYPEMTVRAYLGFCARLKHVRPSEAVDQVLDAVALRDVQGRLVRHLSKGFRQRVGLAQALIGQPALLILDEPSSGLDPEQRREIRDLLVRLAGGDTTVLLSTHVLSEVEAICDRVIVIDKGRLLADGTVEDLAQASRRVSVTVARPGPELEEGLRGIAGVTSVDAQPDGVYTVAASDDVRERVARVAVAAGLLELRAHHNLEDAFMRLTRGADA